MADESDSESASERWNEIVAQMNDQWIEGMEASTEAQAGFVESWVEAFDSASDEEYVNESFEGYTEAHSVWMDAAEKTTEKMSELANGEEISPNEFRDLWLDAANEAFKKVIGSETFAAMSGQNMEDALDLRRMADESAQETLHELGFSTERDVREIGERLAELERREKKVERELDGVGRKLDRVLDHLEEET